MLKVYVNANFSGNWNIRTAEHDVSTAKSRTWFIILFAGCPIIWAYRLQTQISLPTTAAKYIALSQSLREVIPIMNLLTKFKSSGFNIVSTTPSKVCTAFKDNNGAVGIANVPKMRACTKHINLAYHHFCEHIIQKKIVINPIDTSFQMANIFTKSLCSELFLRHHTAIQYA